MASLNSPRPTGNMVLVDGTLYVVGNFQMASVSSVWEESWGESYDQSENKWKVVDTLKFRFTGVGYVLLGDIKACSFRLFKGDLKRLTKC